MQKETYSKPIVEIEKFKMLDVITTSGTEWGEGDGEGNPNPTAETANWIR